MTEPSDVETLFEQLMTLEAQKRRPPVHLWNPQHTGEIDIVILANGDWLHEGTRIERPALVNLFSTILRREDDAYYLVTPVEKLRITVEDVPFLAIDMEVQGQGTGCSLLFTTNVDDHVVADAAHALTMREGIPYVHVRDGLHAKLARSVYYRLIDVAREEGDEMAVYSQGTRFSLGSVQE